MEKKQLLETIKARLKSTGMTAAEASEKAVGNAYLISNMGRERYGMPSAENLISLCSVLGLEFYVGPPRDDTSAPQPPAADPEEFTNIPLHAASLAAGAGAENGSEPIVDYLSFRRDWLRKIGVAPANAVLARVSGESMEPTICGGDMVLIDTSKVEIQSRGRARKTAKPPIYAFVEGGQARVKRIELVDTNFYAIMSDNSDFAAEFKTNKALDDMKIIGKVMWWGHTNRE